MEVELLKSSCAMTTLITPSSLKSFGSAERVVIHHAEPCGARQVQRTNMPEEPHAASLFRHVIGRETSFLPDNSTYQQQAFCAPTRIRGAHPTGLATDRLWLVKAAYDAV
jgi:hypothetical protein